MTNSIGRGQSLPRDYSLRPDSAPQAAGAPRPTAPARPSVNAHHRLHPQGSLAWLRRQLSLNDQAGDQPQLRRTLSALATPDAPHAGNGFEPWSAKRMRKGPDLDALYGSVQPPRAKPGRLSGIQKAERREDGMVIVHPERIVVNPKITPDLSEELQAVRRDLKDGAVYKWNISRNGQLMLAKSKHPNGEKLGWGHPTLVGGLREPEARIGGELRFGKPARTSSTKTTKSAQPSPSARGGGRHRLISRLLSNKGAPKPSFYINNDSGRYSEYIDRKKAMLNNVAIRFQEVDFPVKTQWLDKVKVPLKNPGAYPESDKRKTTGSSKPVESTIKFVARVWRLLGNA